MSRVHRGVTRFIFVLGFIKFWKKSIVLSDLFLFFLYLLIECLGILRFKGHLYSEQVFMCMRNIQMANREG